MNQFPLKVKEKLDSLIQEMSEHYWLYTNRPGHDFTRQKNGKLSFFDTINMIISMGKDTTNLEISRYFEHDINAVPSQSAFCQRRRQILPAAFEVLFNEFSASFPATTHRFKDCCLLAVDGTHVVYSTNPEILADYNKPRLADHKGYNHMHLNALVDVFSKAALDVVIQPGQLPDEREALRTMLDHFQPDEPQKYIITADRGYESYDLLFQCAIKSLNFIFRAKAPSSYSSMLSSFKSELPDDKEEFDVTVKRFFSDKYTKIMKQQKDVYHYMNPNKNIPHFQEFLNGKHLRFFTIRVLKIKTSEDTYEYIITNLPASFCLEDIRFAYHMRWGIEVTFRYIKHSNGLLYFHSKKPEFLKQEIYANLILYNFGIFLANEAIEENHRKRRNKNNKYEYEVDISDALRLAREYFVNKHLHKKMDVIGLMVRLVHAVKEEFRQFARPMRGIGAVRFAYR